VQPQKQGRSGVVSNKTKRSARRPFLGSVDYGTTFSALSQVFFLDGTAFSLYNIEIIPKTKRRLRK